MLIQTLQDTLTGHATEKDFTLEGAVDTFLAQYGFNSQIVPDQFDPRRMEKKSGETFREYA